MERAVFEQQFGNGCLFGLQAFPVENTSLRRVHWHWVAIEM